ncbi:MAG: sensor histidine kinase [Halioglobus sp.]
MNFNTQRPAEFPWTPTLLIAGFALIAATAALLFYRFSVAPPEGALETNVVYFCPTQASQEPAADDPCWTQTYLPHDWRQSEVDTQHGWYTFDLELNVPPNRLWMMYLPRVTSNVLAELNGEAIGHGGRFEEPVARNWARPLSFSIPSGILRNGVNRFSLYVAPALGSPGYLGPIYLGPQELLTPAYNRNHALRVGSVESINFSLVLVAFLILGHWITRPMDKLHVWFAAMSLAWALHNLNLIVVEIPVSTRLWETFRHLTLGWFVVFLVLAMHRYIDEEHPIIERIVVVVALVASLLLIIMPNDEAFIWYAERIWLTTTAALGAYPAFRVLQAWWRSWNPEYFIGMCAGSPILLAGLHDTLRANGWLPREHGFFIQYTAPILLLGFTVVLLIRFARALNDSEALNQSLELRVEKKREQLEENYKQLASLERSQALASERERIMRDMHDGVGGQLVSALAMSESETLPANQLQGLLNDALLDLRLMIDSLDEVDGDLVSLLGTLRSRMQPALDQSGIQVHWEVQDIPAIAELGPDRSLQIMRILQEAVTNVIKHSKATNVHMRTGETNGDVYIEIKDDGKGFEGNAGRGRGLHNMQYRAKNAGAKIDIETGNNGTSVKIIVPKEESIPNTGDTDNATNV